jgi:hypothetical protein
LVAVTTTRIGVFDAHGATCAFTRAGTGVPLPRALALTGIRLSRNAIGWRTRARGVDGRTARRRRRRTILCIRRHHPNRRSQNAHACDSDQSAFHRYLPFVWTNKCAESNARVRRMFQTIPGQIAIIAPPEALRRVRPQKREPRPSVAPKGGRAGSREPIEKGLSVDSAQATHRTDRKFPAYLLQLTRPIRPLWKDDLFSLGRERVQSEARNRFTTVQKNKSARDVKEKPHRSGAKIVMRGTSVNGSQQFLATPPAGSKLRECT